MRVQAQGCLALLLWLWCSPMLAASDSVDAMLARSEVRLGGMGGSNAEADVPPKPPFGEALVSPLNIATFLAGVGVAEAVNAQLLDDPMKLQEYFHSLSQPLTYIAFMIFDMSRYSISRSLYPFTSNPHTLRSHHDFNFIDKTGGYIALAGASTVLHLLFEIIYSPHFKKLQNAPDATLFKQHLHDLWRENFLSRDRWISRGLGTATLLAAAVSQGYVASLRLPLQTKIKNAVYSTIANYPLMTDNLLLKAAYDGRGLYVQDIVAVKKSVADNIDVNKYLDQPIKLKEVTVLMPRFKLKGKYLAVTGGSIGLLLHVLDMALFIEFDHLYTALLEQPLWEFIYSRRIAKLTAAITQLCVAPHPDLPQLRQQLDRLSQSWFDYRMLFVLKMVMRLRSWQDELLRQDRRFYQRLAFYRWLIKGGDYHDAHFTSNTHNWHAAADSAQFHRTKTKMLKDMLYGFRQTDFFNYSFHRQTIASQHFPAIIPDDAAYPRRTLALLQHMQAERSNFMAMFEQWGRAFGAQFETKRRSFIGRYNDKTRETFRDIYLTDKRSLGSMRRLPRSPLRAFDDEVNALYTILQRVVVRKTYPKVHDALAELQKRYTDLSQRRAEKFLLDEDTQQQARTAIATQLQNIRRQLQQLPARVRGVAQVLAERLELTMIYRFAYVSLGTYLLNHNKLYLEQEE